MDRLQNTFDALSETGDTAIIPFITAGFPSVEDTLRLVPALVEGGASIIELGVPYSDPLADGHTIQRASFKALENGVTPSDCLSMVRQLREAGVQVPLVLMGYYNPILSYGLERFTTDAEQAGVDGLIVPDLPCDEASPLYNECRKRSIAFIPLLAPTSNKDRIAKTCAIASGFIYCVSITGITGTRDEMSSGIPEMTQKIREHTNLPLAIGFGISQRRHVEAISPWAQAAVVGSALIEAVEQSEAEHRANTVRNFVADLRGPAKANGGPSL